MNSPFYFNRSFMVINDKSPRQVVFKDKLEPFYYKEMADLMSSFQFLTLHTKDLESSTVILLGDNPFGKLLVHFFEIGEIIHLKQEKLTCPPQFQDIYIISTLEPSEDNYCKIVRLKMLLKAKEVIMSFSVLKDGMEFYNGYKYIQPWGTEKYIKLVPDFKAGRIIYDKKKFEEQVFYVNHILRSTYFISRTVKDEHLFDVLLYMYILVDYCKKHSCQYKNVDTTIFNYLKIVDENKKFTKCRDRISS